MAYSIVNTTARKNTNSVSCPAVRSNGGVPKWHEDRAARDRADTAARACECSPSSCSWS